MISLADQTLFNLGFGASFLTAQFYSGHLRLDKTSLMVGNRIENQCDVAAEQQRAAGKAKQVAPRMRRYSLQA